MDNSLSDRNVDLQQINMEVESFNESIQSPNLQFQKSNTGTIKDNLQQLGLSKEIAVYKTSAQSKIKTQPNYTSAGNENVESEKSVRSSEIYQLYFKDQQQEEEKQQEDAPLSSRRPMIRFKESNRSEKSESEEDWNTHQNSEESLYDKKKHEHTFKKLVSLTLSQKDYYVTDGEKTIIEKEEHIDKLIQELVLNNRFMQRMKKQEKKQQLNDSYEKRKLAFKHLLSAPMDLKLYYRRNTLKVNLNKLKHQQQERPYNTDRENKIFKLYKRAQTLNHLRITFESLKEIYNDPEILKSHAPHLNTAQQRWAKLRRALITIIKMRHWQIKRLEQASDILSEIRRFPERKGERALEKIASRANVHNPIDENRRINDYFSYIAFGGVKGLDRIKYMLDKDPKRHMLDINSRLHMLNNRNYVGMTPLYVACLNGHLDIVQYLIQRGANPYMHSKLQNKEKEKVIVVSARWNHKEITKYLLDNFQWSQKDIQQALKNTNKNSDCYMLLKQYSTTNFGRIRTICCIGGIFK